jgi:hypothetical protein
MTGTTKGIVLRLVFALIVASAMPVETLYADASLLVYPSTTALFRYVPSHYEVVTAGDPRFDPAFSIGGLMLWDRAEDRIAAEVYRAPDLAGFEPSPTGFNEFLTVRNELTVIVDGYGEHPRSLANLQVRFLSTPQSTPAQIELDGLPTPSSCTISGFPVVTPTGDGHYADVVEHHLRWSGALGVRVAVFMDKDADGALDGGRPRFTIYAIDSAVPVEETSWGRVKALYAD